MADVAVDSSGEGREVDESSLTYNQRRFVEEFAIDRNRVQAYFRAYGRNNPDGNPKSYTAASVSADRLLDNPRVIAEIEAAEKAIRESRRIDRQKILDLLIESALLDPMEFFEPQEIQGQKVITMRPLNEVPPGIRRCIQQMKVKTLKGGVIQTELKFISKESMAEKLAKHLGMQLTDNSSELVTELLTQLKEHQQEKASA